MASCFTKSGLTEGLERRRGSALIGGSCAGFDGGSLSTPEDMILESDIGSRGLGGGGAYSAIVSGGVK